MSTAPGRNSMKLRQMRMSLAQVLMLSVVLVAGTESAQQKLMLGTQEGLLNPESGPKYVLPELCPESCLCNITVENITVKHCTKDPSAALNLMLEHQTNITALIITSSHLTQVPQRVCHLNHLITLIVTNNSLETLPWQCLRRLQCLHHLDVSHNHIKQLENGSFYDMHLQQLILHHNQIFEIGVDVFTQPQRLTELATIDISWNRLKSLDPWPIMFTNTTTTILLNDNQIAHFTNFIAWTYKCISSHPLQIIDLRNNWLTHLSELFKAWNFTPGFIKTFCLILNKNITIAIGGNRFICDCVEFNMIRMLDGIHIAKVEDLVCDKPVDLHGKKIISIPLTKLICHVKEKCPSPCDCIDQPINLNMSILCNNSRIEAMPDELPKLSKFHYHYHLNFVDNRITTFEYRPYMKMTKIALFTRNFISEVSLHALQSLRNADLVALDNNKLKYLPKNISSVNMTLVKDIHLANNEWACDCHAKETQRWLIQMQAVISDKSGILCQSPPRMNGSNLLLISEDDLICGNPHNNVLIAILTTVGACIVLVIPFIFIYIKRVWLFKRFHLHPFDSTDREEDNKEFDVFVSYANENAAYVENYLISTLQSKGYKIAYHRIHFHVGKPIHVSIEKCVKNSKRTLAVISNEFLKSEWCMWEFTVALEYDRNCGTNHLLTIKYEDVQVSSQHPTIQAYFRQHSYIEPSSKTFWDNLEYVLPVEKMGEEGSEPYNVIDVELEETENVEGPGCCDDDVIADDDRAYLIGSN